MSHKAKKNQDLRQSYIWRADKNADFMGRWDEVNSELYFLRLKMMMYNKEVGKVATIFIVKFTDLLVKRAGANMKQHKRKNR